MQPACEEDLAAFESMPVTPMMQQYLNIKANNPDCLLFYRMGDFYELFFEDAEQASVVLGITLTKRGKHAGKDIPMCGVPVERSDDYLQRLIARGLRVAVCEQLEDPAEAKKRGAKSVVERGVVRLVTPGTITEETLLEPARANHLVALAGEGDAFGLAAVDISTGAFSLLETDRFGLTAEIARLEPAEILVPEAVLNDAELAAALEALCPALTPLSRDLLDERTAERRLQNAFDVLTTDGFGLLSALERLAAAAAVGYIERTQKGNRIPLAPPARLHRGAYLEIDAATRANLELTRTLSGARTGSLLDTIDRTVTAAGGRLLAERLASPLTDVAAISARHDAVELLAGDTALRRDARGQLKGAPDLLRALQRLMVGRGGPRDLAGIRDGLNAAHALGLRLNQVYDLPADLASARDTLTALDRALPQRLEAALDDELPLRAHEGGFIRGGYEKDLDAQRALKDNSRRIIAELQTRYTEETGIRTLRIKHTGFLGYFVEVPVAQGENLRQAPWNERFVHRQTLQGAMRFSSVELAELDSKISAAADKAIAIESGIFTELVRDVAAHTEAIKSAASALAELDVTAALAELAVQCLYTRPEIDDSLAFHIEEGRHPVVERVLKGETFVANGCDLSPPAAGAGRICLLTGPNMAGKSTYLRQNALIVLLAQMGSFVPARCARFGVVDRLFSRVGAADDLARGRSTFMVEMVETAAILNQATRRSLVILDEIGRGTATFDGLSIAWATVEHLHDANACRALFATHYHELTHLTVRLPRLFNATAKVKEWKGHVVFLHEIVPGAADRSYGIQVGKLAGLPPGVIKRAQGILTELEKGDRTAPILQLVNDLPLFSAMAPSPAAPAPEEDPLRDLLDSLNPDQMSPRDALNALYQLKGLVD